MKNKLRKSLGLTAIAAVTALASFSANAGCSGNACDVMYLQKVNGCLYAVNTSTRPVKFSHGVGHAPTVYGNSREKILTIRGAANRSGECMRKIINWSAKYK